jgi:hypothetical protein
MSRDTVTLKPRGFWRQEWPQQDDLAKILITVDLQSAEVVELADTPS